MKRIGTIAGVPVYACNALVTPAVGAGGLARSCSDAARGRDGAAIVLSLAQLATIDREHDEHVAGRLASWRVAAARADRLGQRRPDEPALAEHPIIPA